MGKGNRGEALGFCYGEFMSILKEIHNSLFKWRQFNFMQEMAEWNYISRNPHNEVESMSSSWPSSATNWLGQVPILGTF